MIKIASFNINGLRSYLRRSDVPSLSDVFGGFDVVCLQETKLASGEHTVDVAGFDTAAWATPRHASRTGYSGVATLVRADVPVLRSQSAFGDRMLDDEGRVVRTVHSGGLVLWNVYFPNEGRGLQHRQAFFDALFQRIERDWQDEGSVKCVLVVGDFNCCCRRHDHCMYADDADDDRLLGDDREADMRGRLKRLVEEEGWADCFRIVHPDRTRAYTCWNTKLGTRASNYGTRIDLCLFKQSPQSGLSNARDPIVDADIMADVMGSDHCPTWVALSLPGEDGHRPVPVARRKQPRLTDFFSTESQATTPQLPAHEMLPVPAEKRTKRTTTITTFFEILPPPAVSEERGISRLAADTASSSPASSATATEAWQAVGLGRPREAPRCRGHGEPCKLLRVSKKGPNQGRQFYVCARAVGPAHSPDHRCEHFEWARP